MNDELRKELLDLIARDEAIRGELAANGSLFEGYHPEMEKVHQTNAARLQQIINQHGWPGKSLVGEDGAEAAWRIAQHAIGEPDFQRSVLALLKSASACNEIPAWQPAMLEDRIRFFEGKLQIYGTQFDWDSNGELNPCPGIEKLEAVNERRSAVGLGPLQEDIQRRREAILKSGEKKPKDFAKRKARFEEWARKVGWRK